MSSYTEFQVSHNNCIVCGDNNPVSLGLRFEAESDGSVRSSFRGSSLFQGYSGILHGGIIATLLDSTMTHCLFHHGIKAVTGDIQVRFLKPVPFNSLLTLRAKLVSSYPPLYKLDSEVLCDKQVMARCQGRFMVDKAHF